VSPQFCDWMAMETKHIMGGENVSTGGDPSPWTALGVFNSMKACLEAAGDGDFTGLTIGIQGCGATGFKLAKLCREAGAAVLVTDVHVPSMKRCVEELGCMAVGNDRNLFHEELDVLAPCALGAVLGPESIPQLRCRIVCGTANNQLVDPVRDGRALDFVANAGGLIRLAGLYLGMSEAEIDAKVAGIERTTHEVLKEALSAPSTAEAAIAYAKRRIEKKSPVATA
ncbi:MAG: hypothetical protein RJA16_531, partial [Planctomycetota bacterium]